MYFHDIIGQEQIKERLRQMVSHQKLGHALLFSGAQGVGHLGLALSLASYLVCDNRNETESCGQCAHCKRAHKNLHPDIHFAFPVVLKSSKKREDTFSNDFLVEWRALLENGPYFSEAEWLENIGAGNRQGDINKKECIEMIKSLGLKSFSSTQKVLILWLPEYLGKNGNRLLKLIEEPPDNSYIFLVTNQPERILNTIISRCQTIAVPAVTDEDLISYAKTQSNFSDELVQKAVYMADGDVIALIKYLEGAGQQDIADAFFKWITMCMKPDAASIVNWVDEYAGLGKEWQKQFFRFGLSYLRELMSYAILGTDRTRLSSEGKHFADHLLKYIDLEKLKILQQRFDEYILLIERNVNAKPLMMASSLRLGQVLREDIRMNIIKEINN